MLGPPLFFMNLLILNLFFNFNCLNMDILLNMYTLVITFYTGMLKDRHGGLGRDWRY